MDILGSGPAELQTQSQQPLAGPWSDSAFGNDFSCLDDTGLGQTLDQTHLPDADALHNATILTRSSWTGFLFDQQREAANAEPGSLTPGVTVGVALRLPLAKLPSDIQSAMASGCYQQQKVLAEVSAGTTFTATSKVAVEDKQAPRRRRVRRTERTSVPATELECGQCNRSFNCKKDLRRHQRSTKAHGAPEVAKCSCGKGVTRVDAMKSHRRFCRGSTLPPDGTTVGNGTI